MKKKMVAVLLTLALTGSLMSGCGNAAEEGTDTTGNESQGEENAAGQEEREETGTGEQGREGEEEEEEDLAEITVSFWSLATVPQEVDLVEEAINEITEPEIGVTVNLNIMDVGSYIPNGAMANGVANGEDFDLVCTAAALSGHYSVMMSNGMLLPMSDLLKEYAPELLDTVSEDFLGATTKNGEIYAVPSYSNKIKNMYWLCRTEVLEQAGIDISTVTDVEALEEALVKIKEKCPDYIPLGGASTSIQIHYPSFDVFSGKKQAAWDALGDGTAVAAAVYYDDETLTAVSQYETEGCKKGYQTVKKWYDMGLIDKDIATDTATSDPLLDKENIASAFAVGQFDVVGTKCLASDSQSVLFAEAVIDTSVMQQFTWAIPVSCDEPEAAASFLNMLYTDERIVNLVDFGIEGKHWERKEDGTIGFPDGVTAENSGYYLGNLTAIVGNGFLAYPWEGADPNSAAMGKEAMENATYSPLLGFCLDTEALGDIYAGLCTIAHTEYGPALGTGSAPDGYYEEFIEKMYATGLEEYIKQVNEQVQAWLTEQE